MSGDLPPREKSRPTDDRGRGRASPRQVEAGRRGRLLLRPSVLILVAANLVPLIGVIFWGWDAFVLLMLYWLEAKAKAAAKPQA